MSALYPPGVSAAQQAASAPAAPPAPSGQVATSAGAAAPAAAPAAGQVSTPAPGAATPASMAPPAERPSAGGVSTPGLLRALRNLSVLACLIFTGLAILGTAVPAYSMQATVADFQQGQRLREARADLARSDQIAGDAFLADKPASELEPFQSALGRVSQLLIEAAAAHPGDADRLVTVQEQVTTYRRQVEAAATAADLAQSRSAYTAAGPGLDAPLAALTELADASDNRVTLNLQDRMGVLAIVSGWVALALLLLTSVLLARRTHRVVNLGLGLAIILLAAATLVLTDQYSRTQVSQATALGTSVASARAAQDAQTAAFRAKAAEGRLVLTGTDTYQSEWTRHATDVSQALGSLRPPTLASVPTTQWNGYRTAHEALSPTAADAKVKTRAATATLTTFTTTVRRIGQTQDELAAQSLLRTTDPLIGVAALCGIGGLAAAVAAGLGVGRRLAEYR